MSIHLSTILLFLSVMPMLETNFIHIQVMVEVESHKYYDDQYLTLYLSFHLIHLNFFVLLRDFQESKFS